jgi:[pyruvate, water dikinase]-phosphate phosphotransferase / [pyruvate, water dikinase] kinase
MKPARKPGRSSARKRRRVLHVLSDSTGNLAKHMVAAFLTQFPADAFDVHIKGFLETPALIDEAFGDIDPADAIVLHACVSAKAKQAIESRARRARLPSLDLTGGFVEFLAKQSGVKPAADIRRLHSVDDNYDRRIEALEFAITHDDGMSAETIHQADVVLAGVSRTSKTPTSIYLAQQGYKVANVSLATGIAPPAALLRLRREQVVGLIIDPHDLAAIRKRRQTEWKMPDGKYNELDRVIEEVEWSRRLFAKQRWHVIDVTNRAIEETAGRILQHLGSAPAKG